ncbi:MAG: hypothetical protein MJZ93_05715 [Paludibacteraceae bacterium]|nr:hypothetical protein [Paludibacteraceae bacterium]
MPKYRFHVVGIRYHDYANNLEELYQKAEGKSMTMQLEEENPLEKNAVRVNMVSKFVGYVMSGKEREQAEELVRNERLSVRGSVVEIDREHRMITLEVNTTRELECKGIDRDNELREWKYDGRLLRQSDEEITLIDVINNLQMCAEQQEPYDENMESYLEFIADNLWRDAGVNTQCQLDEIVHLLTANSDVVKGYDKAAKRLLFIKADVNSPAKRQRQVDNLYELAKSSQMKKLIGSLGDKAMKVIDEIPVSLVQLFDSDPQEYVGRLWYLRCSYRQLRQLQTLMAMRIAMTRLNDKPVIEFDEILIGGEETFNNLGKAMESHYMNSTKNLALIYCVLRDNGLLVCDRKYHLFVQFLVERGLLPWINEKRIKGLSDSMSQYMRDRKDHNKIRRGFSEDYHEWEEGKERLFCEEVSMFFVNTYSK